MSTVDQEQEILFALAVGQTRGQLQQELTTVALEHGSFQSVSAQIPKAAAGAARDSFLSARQLRLEMWPLTAPEYPRLLREISAPPPLLFVRRAKRIGEVTQSTISVVGRRVATLDVCQQATRLGLHLAQAGITVVSGLALGIDAAAHRGALATSLECPTIAVLAHGLDSIYPPSHAGLAKQIVDSGGMLISEYPPGAQALKHHFLARNRIIAGLARGVVVVQAAKRSGSLVTARCAADYGRDVFVLCGDEDPEARAGGDELLEQGAIPIEGAREILAEYQIESGFDCSAKSDDWICESVESFMIKRGCSAAELLSLELQGVVERLPGNRVRHSACDGAITSGKNSTKNGS